MNRLILIIVSGIVAGGVVWYIFSHGISTPQKSQTTSADTMTMEAEVKRVLMFMHPHITEEVADEYLDELKTLNKQYGYTSGGEPKGDIETMRAYAGAVEVIQKKYNMMPQADTQAAPASGYPQPHLAPQQTDTMYMPPSQIGSQSTTTQSPALQTAGSQKPLGPTANPNSGAAKGGPASTPPLIQQDNLPPAPPVPPQMSSE